MVFVAVGALAGAVLASRRYRAFLLVPVAASMAAVAFLVGIVHGSHPGAIALEVLGSIVAPQFAYVALSLTAHLTRLAKLVPHSARKLLLKQLSLLGDVFIEDVFTYPTPKVRMLFERL
jgi:hypothetical protein